MDEAIFWLFSSRHPPSIMSSLAFSEVILAVNVSFLPVEIVLFFLSSLKLSLSPELLSEPHAKQK